MHDKKFYARHPGERETRCPIFTLPRGQTGPAPPSAGVSMIGDEEVPLAVDWRVAVG
nr:hypothetical protein [Streptomyces sp. WAC 01325]